MFVKRLAQREYDLLLISPLKRRILLKLFCMGKCSQGGWERGYIPPSLVLFNRFYSSVIQSDFVECL